MLHARWHERDGARLEQLLFVEWLTDYSDRQIAIVRSGGLDYGKKRSELCHSRQARAASRMRAPRRINRSPLSARMNQLAAAMPAKNPRKNMGCASDR